MVVSLSALRIGRFYPPGNIPGTHFCCSYILFIIIIGGILDILFIIIIGGILVLFIYIYITRLASNEIFSPSNKINREVGRDKDLSASLYRGADKSLARQGRKQATATEDFDVHISYL
jgi:hypothetical protein